MTPALAFHVPGEPAGKGRARATTINGRPSLYTPKKTAAYEGLIAWAAKTAMGSRPPLPGPLAVEIEATLTIPLSWPKKRKDQAKNGLRWPSVKPDCDNIAKAVCDGGNGVAWADDKQVVDLRVIKRYGDAPGLKVTVFTMEDAS